MNCQTDNAERMVKTASTIFSLKITDLSFSFIEELVFKITQLAP